MNVLCSAETNQLIFLYIAATGQNWENAVEGGKGGGKEKKVLGKALEWGERDRGGKWVVFHDWPPSQTMVGVSLSLARRIRSAYCPVLLFIHRDFLASLILFKFFFWPFERTKQILFSWWDESDCARVFLCKLSSLFPHYTLSWTLVVRLDILELVWWPIK